MKLCADEDMDKIISLEYMEYLVGSFGSAAKENNCFE